MKVETFAGHPIPVASVVLGSTRNQPASTLSFLQPQLCTTLSCLQLLLLCSGAQSPWPQTRPLGGITTHSCSIGKPYRIIGAQRIPYQYWYDRLYKAHAMGLNTIFSYVFWDQVEPTPGNWDFTGQNNLPEYFRLVQEVGLNVVLRAGPYICGEHEWGGFPA